MLIRSMVNDNGFNIIMLCYCGSGEPFEKCCSPLIQGESVAQSPEQLMRSRYSAYCSQNMNYLVDTQHSSTRHPSLNGSIEASFENTDWVALRVIDAQSQGKTGTVEFVAFFNSLPQLQEQPEDVPKQLREKSNFVFENSMWFYVDGEILPDLKIGRNDPCWCGSHKKFKKCHG